MIKKIYKNNKETAQNFFWRSLQIFSRQGVAFLIFFTSAFYLTPERFGLYSYLMAAIGFLMMFCDFGVSAASSKFVAEYKVRNSRYLNQLLFSVVYIILIFAGIISLIIILAGKLFFKEYYFYSLLFIPYLFFVPLTSVLNGYYMGLKEFKKLALISSFVGLFSLGIFFFLIKKYLLIGAILSQNLIYILYGLCLLFFLKNISFKINMRIIHDVFKYSFVLGVFSLMYFLYTRADILILKYLGYLTEIGYYDIINKVIMMIIMPFTILGQVLGPDVTRDYTMGKYELIKKNFKKQITFSLCIGIFGSCILYFIFPYFLRVFLPKYYTPATILMFKLMLFTLPLSLMAEIVNHAHTVPTGNAHFLMWTMIPAGIANVILDFYLGTKFGVVGIIYTTLICYTFAILSFVSLYYLKLKRLVKND